MQDDLKTRIKNQLFCSAGYLNPNILRDDSDFKNSELFNDIIRTIPNPSIPIKIKIKLILDDRLSLPVCYCGKTANFNSTTFNIYCSHKCSTNSKISKHRRKITMIAHHGVEHAAQSSQIKEKTKATNLKKYGCEHSSQSSIVKEKTKATNLKKYGGHHNTINQIKEKTKATNLKKYGVICHTQADYSLYVKNILFNKKTFINFATDKHAALLAHLLSVDKTTISEYVKKYDCKDILASCNNSKWETIVAEYLDKLNIKYEQNTKKIIAPQELDFYLLDYNVAIELNGNYWHSELAGGKDKNYHFNKWQACKEKGINLYSYFEDELIDNIDVVKAKLRYLVNKNKIIIGGRKCKIKDVNYKDERAFLNEHHIQGSSSARNKVIGAYYNDQLVAIFGWQLRKNYLEITRYACDTKASYPGLFSKMMKHMITELDYHGEVVSFSNNGHSNGGVYKASGFQVDKILGPAYWYLSKNYLIRENRQGYMKSKIQKKFDYDMTNKTEWQAMQELGYDRIWDSGKIKWVRLIY